MLSDDANASEQSTHLNLYHEDLRQAVAGIQGGDQMGMEEPQAAVLPTPS